MGGNAAFELPLTALYADAPDAFDALVRHVCGIDRELLFASGMRGFVIDVPPPVKGKPCALKPEARAALSGFLATGRIVVRRKGDAVHVTLKPIKRTQDLSHPVDARSKTQRKNDKADLQRYSR